VLLPLNQQLLTLKTEYRARVKKNPPVATAPKKATPPPPAANSKGKGKASGTKAVGGASKTSNGKGIEIQDAADEEEPFSEPDLVGEGEDDIDLEEEVEPLDDNEEEEEVVNQMELDDVELRSDSKGLDAKADDSEHD
jgi:hypothetical protein